MLSIPAGSSTLATDTAMILRVPSDVLRIIFEDAQAAEGLHRRLPFALKISSVCSFWRAIAIDASTLWTTVYVPLEDRPEPVPLRTYLARSRSRPLDIIFGRRPANADLLDEAIACIYTTALVEHIDKWRSIMLDAGVLEPSLWPQVSWVRRTCATIEPTYGGLSRGLRLFDDDLCAPALRNLTLWSTPSIGQHLAVTQAFPGLRDLTIMDGGRTFNMTLGRYLELFAALPLLEHLRLVGSPIISWTMATQMRPMLAALKELWLEAMPPAIISAHFRCMAAPRLERLVARPLLRGDGWVSDFQQPPIMQSARWFPRLRTLVLEPTWSDKHITPYPMPGDFAGFVAGFEHFNVTIPGNVNALLKNALMHSFMTPELFEKADDKDPMHLVKMEVCSDTIKASALLRTVKWCSEPDPDDPEDEGRVSIKELELVVFSSAEPDNKSLVWFKDHLKDFRWRLKDGTNLDDSSVRFHYRQPKAVQK